ncbi:hypothetical protein [Paenibacillus cymbidii]|uniref:hypothetical protein n=1 Tax=Paenibacillus cymbidii TaxID=1639034 RepID=UPI001081ADC6|nr:hypothetical protein [Paenibacillus cymbidii]
MSESNEPRKVSLADAIKNKLAQKQQAQKDANAAKGKGDKGAAAGSPKIQSQMTKKVNNQRRRTGGS